VPHERPWAALAAFLNHHRAWSFPSATQLSAPGGLEAQIAAFRRSGRIKARCLDGVLADSVAGEPHAAALRELTEWRERTKGTIVARLEKLRSMDDGELAAVVTTRWRRWLTEEARQHARWQTDHQDRPSGDASAWRWIWWEEAWLLQWFGVPFPAFEAPETSTADDRAIAALRLMVTDGEDRRRYATHPATALLLAIERDGWAISIGPDEAAGRWWRSDLAWLARHGATPSQLKPARDASRAHRRGAAQMLADRVRLDASLSQLKRWEAWQQACIMAEESETNLDGVVPVPPSKIDDIATLNEWMNPVIDRADVLLQSAEERFDEATLLRVDDALDDAQAILSRANGVGRTVQVALRRVRSMGRERDDLFVERRLRAALSAPGARVLSLLENVALVMTLFILIGMLIVVPGPGYIDAWANLDAMLCGVLLAGVGARWVASPRRWDFFRRYALTEILPSLPFPWLALHLAPNAENSWLWATILPLFRFLRYARILLLLQRVSDRVMRRLRPWLDRDVWLFGEHQRPTKQAPTSRDLLLLALRRLRVGARHRADETIIEQSSERVLPVERLAAIILARMERHGSAAWEHDGDYTSRAPRGVETLVEPLQRLDGVAVELALGPEQTSRLGRGLNIAWPLLRPLMGWRAPERYIDIAPTTGARRPLSRWPALARHGWPARRAPRRRKQPSAELVAAVGRRMGDVLDWLLNKRIAWFRDLYGLVGGAELLSFVGSFLSRMFARYQNRLVMGILILLLGYGMILLAQGQNSWRVRISLPELNTAQTQRVIASLEHEFPPLDGKPDVHDADGTPGGGWIAEFEGAVRTLGDRDDVRRRSAIAISSALSSEGIRMSTTAVDVSLRLGFWPALGVALQKSFGAVLVILGMLGVGLVWLGRWMTKRAGMLVEEHQRVAEAQFLALSKDLKQSRASEDLRFLATRSLGADHAPLDAMHNLANGRDVASDIPEIPRKLAWLFRDYLDGAPFHPSDRKTATQLLGNLTLRPVYEDIRYNRRDKKRLERLDLSRARSLTGPSMWFTWLTGAMSQRLGKLLVLWHERIDRKSITAVELLEIGERDDSLALRIGPAAARGIRHDVRAIVREVFGCYPVALRSVNLSEFYQRRYEGGGRLYRVPFDLILLAARTSWMVVRVLSSSLRGVLNPKLARPGPPAHSNRTVAHRKLFRMRRPILAESLRLRAWYDPAYLDIVPRGGSSTVLNDWARDSARVELDAETLTEIHRIGVHHRKRLALFERWRSEGTIGGAWESDPHGVWLAYLAVSLDLNDIGTLLEADAKFLEVAEEALRRPSWFGLDRWLWPFKRFGSYVVGSNFNDELLWNFWRERTGLMPEALRALGGGWRHWAMTRAYRRNEGNLRCIVEACVERQALKDPVAVANTLLARLYDRRDDYLERLSMVRAVQTLALLDILNDQRSIDSLAGFTDDSD